MKAFCVLRFLKSIFAALSAAALVMVLSSCGVKGPPLPPIDSTLTPEQIELQEQRDALRESEEESEGTWPLGFGKKSEDVEEASVSSEPSPTPPPSRENTKKIWPDF